MSKYESYPDVTGQILRYWKKLRPDDNLYIKAKLLNFNDKIKIVEVPTNDWSMEDLKGDTFKPHLHPDIAREKLEEEELEFEEKVHREGATGIVGLVKNRKFNEWEQVDAIWTFVGSEWLGSEYDIDMLKRIIDIAVERGLDTAAALAEEEIIEERAAVKEKQVRNVDDVIRLMRAGHRILMPVTKYMDVEKYVKENDIKDKLMFWEDEERTGFVRAFFLEASKKVLGNPSGKPPKKAALNAKRGLELRKKWGRGGTVVGVARARDLANEKTLSTSTIKRMASFNRHRKNSDPSKRHRDGGPTAGYIAWLLWGGDAGIDWAIRQAQK